MSHFLLGVALIASLAAQTPVVQVPVPAPTAPSQPSRSGDVRGTYTVGPTDILKVTVFNEPDLTVSLRIDDDGSISYPLLGRLPVGQLPAGTYELRIRVTDGTRELSRAAFFTLD